MGKRIAAVVASLIVSGVFLWLTLRGLPINEVFGSIAEANLLLVLVVIVLGLLGLVTRGIRWRGLVNNRISQRRAFYIIGITFLLNQLPFRLGEVARAALATRERIPVMTAATSIVVERLLDTVIVLIILSVCISQIDVLPAEITDTAPVFGVLAVLAFGVLLTLARFPQFARNTLHAITTRLTFLQRLPLDDLLEQTLDGLQPLINPGRFAHAVLWTLISWALSYSVFYVAQLAMGLPADAFLSAALALSLASFSVAVPVTVAAIGPFEAAVRVAGQVFNVEPVTSTALGFLVHAVSIIGYSIAGVIGFLGLGVSFGDVIQQEAPTDRPAA